jgi:hypothetical protein
MGGTACFCGIPVSESKMLLGVTKCAQAANGLPSEQRICEVRAQERGEHVPAHGVLIIEGAVDVGEDSLEGGEFREWTGR